MHAKTSCFLFLSLASVLLRGVDVRGEANGGEPSARTLRSHPLTLIGDSFGGDLPGWLKEREVVATGERDWRGWLRDDLKIRQPERWSWENILHDMLQQTASNPNLTKEREGAKSDAGTEIHQSQVAHGETNVSSASALSISGIGQVHFSLRSVLPTSGSLR